MSKRNGRRVIPMLMTSLVSYMHGARAATIAEVISPTSVVLAQANAHTLASLDGKPVFWCGLQAFETWAAPLVGQTVASSPESGITVSIDGRDASLQQLLVRQG